MVKLKDDIINVFKVLVYTDDVKVLIYYEY